MLNKRIASLLVVSMIGLSVVGCQSTVEEPKVTTIEKVEQDIQEESKQELNIVLLDNEVVTMTLLSKYEDNTFNEIGYKAKIENKTDKRIVIQTDGTSVNGVMNDPIFSTTIEPNKVAYVNFYWWGESDMNPNVKSVEDLQNIEGRLIIIDNSTDDIWEHINEVDFIIE